MKKYKLFIFILIIILTVNVYSFTETNKKTKDDEIIKLITKLQGGYPKEPVKYINAKLLGLDGKEINLSDYEGKIIFLNLWATWCPPCRNEMPSIEKLHQKFKNKNFVVIAVSLGEDLKTVKNFTKNYNYNFKILIDKNNQIAKNYSTGSIPVTYIIDKNGYIAAGFTGGRDWFSQDAVKFITELLKK